MKNKKYINEPVDNKKSKYNEMNFEIDAMASANEYTGLIPSAPTSKSELSSYNSLYPPVKPKKNSSKTKYKNKK